jgi:uncharacterized membrane protein (UPF0136 family)
MQDKKPDNKRATITFFFIILLGYIIGIFIKRVQVGLVIGLVLGLLGSGLLRRRK